MRALQTGVVMAAICARFQATEMEARAAIQTVVADLAAGGLDQDQLGNVQIVLAEVINNIVEHAYVGMPVGEVQLKYRLCPDRLALLVCDQGAAFPGHEMPAGLPANVNVAAMDLPEGGFGWYLIRTLTSSLRYRRIKGFNVLKMQFAFTP